MDHQVIEALHNNFEHLAQNQDGIVFWYARDIQPLLEYARWENFETVIARAKTACDSSDQPVENHFREVTKMVPLGSGSSREINDLILTRYACYLIAQNGDPKKDAIAFAQSYFALQTRRQELLQERLVLAERLQARTKLTETERQLSSTLYQHGVKSGRALADFLPTVTLKAKEFAAAITDFNVKKNRLYGVQEIGNEHVKNNKDVRDVLIKSDIRPENLPAEEDIQKLERRVLSQDKKLLKSEKGLHQLDSVTNPQKTQE